MKKASFCLIWALLWSWSGISVAQTVAIGSYGLPPGTLATGITRGPDGALWFTEPGANTIGRISIAGVISLYPAQSPGWITTGPDSALWYTYNGGVGRMTTAGIVTEYPVSNCCGDGITTGPDGALWFVAYNEIGRITTSGTVTEYPLHSGSDPYSIAAGPDGALWFTDNAANRIGRITTVGVIKEYAVPTANAYLAGITAGPDGALWFAETDSGNVGRITTAGMITEYPTTGSPNYITTGPDGALWFTSYFDGAIGRMTTSGIATEYPIPNALPKLDTLQPYGITVGPGGGLWFGASSLIGQVVLATAGLSVTPARGSYQTSFTFSGTGYAANENVQIYVSGVGSAVLTSASADASGSFTATAAAPPSAFGPRLFLGVGQSSGKVGAASFSAKLLLVLNPASGPVGATVTVQGYGFAASDSVKIFWMQPRTIFGVPVSDGNGTISSFTITVPSGAASGSNLVVGQGLPTNEPKTEATFTVQ